jgi:hypothetical protein
MQYNTQIAELGTLNHSRMTEAMVPIYFKWLQAIPILGYFVIWSSDTIAKANSKNDLVLQKADTKKTPVEQHDVAIRRPTCADPISNLPSKGPLWDLSDLAHPSHAPLFGVALPFHAPQHLIAERERTTPACCFHHACPSIIGTLQC